MLLCVLSYWHLRSNNALCINKRAKKGGKHCKILDKIYISLSGKNYNFKVSFILGDFGFKVSSYFLSILRLPCKVCVIFFAIIVQWQTWNSPNPFNSENHVYLIKVNLRPHQWKRSNKYLRFKDILFFGKRPAICLTIEKLVIWIHCFQLLLLQAVRVLSKRIRKGYSSDQALKDPQAAPKYPFLLIWMQKW